MFTVLNTIYRVSVFKQCSIDFDKKTTGVTLTIDKTFRMDAVAPLIVELPWQKDECLQGHTRLSKICRWSQILKEWFTSGG